MKIIILGAGRVGSSLTESLISENTDITVIDNNEGHLEALSARYDIQTLVGNASSQATLEEAGTRSADMLIAVTQSDDTNLVACKIAALEFKVPLRIARLRGDEYRNNFALLGDNGFAVNHVITPEQAITDYLCKLIEHPGALQALNFADGLLKLVVIKAAKGGRFVGHLLLDIPKLSGIELRIVAIFRGDRLILPDGDSLVKEGDEIFCLTSVRNIRQVLAGFRADNQPVKNIVIAGGGNIGMQVAKRLEIEYQVKLIEVSISQTRVLRRALSKTLILRGNCGDETLLREENIDDMDMFLALTNNDEANIMSAITAKRLGVGRAVALVNRAVYADLFQGNQIDITLSPAQISSNLILAHIRQDNIITAHKLRHGAEILEILVKGESQKSKIIDRTIEQIALPNGVSVGAIVRPNLQGKSEMQIIIPHHDTVILENDHVIVFVPNKSLIRKVEKLFHF
jgi:trk system potassium uptake protein TrkA